MKQKAFTLIELLVVIAIIAILAAILFPVFAQAKVAAKNATSISNMKQINLATIMYCGDADDMPQLVDFPTKRPDGSDEVVTWEKAISPYVGQKVAGKGTRNEPGIFKDALDGQATLFSNRDKRSYALPAFWNICNNGWASDFRRIWNRNEDCSGVRMAQPNVSFTSLAEPAGTISLAQRFDRYNQLNEDGSDWVMGPGDKNNLGNGTWMPAQVGDAGGATPTYLGTPSPGGFNYGFSDGHVKTVQPLRTIGISTDPIFAFGMWSIREAD